MKIISIALVCCTFLALPSYATLTANNAQQYRADTGATIPDPSGTVPSGVGVYFDCAASDTTGATIQMQVELLKLPATFTGTPNYSSSFVASGTRPRTTTATGIGAGNYGWRYRVKNSSGVIGNWVNANNPDFIVQAAAAAPSITSLSPTTMPPQNGNQTLTINGNNFVSGDTLTFVPPEGGTIASTASKLTVSSSAQISYLINNQNDSGNWTVQVNSADGTQHSSAVGFTVSQITPSISSVSPTTFAPLNGNQTLTINGNNFAAGDTLTFVPPEGGTIASTASKLTVNSGSQITYLINNQNDSGNWTVQVNSPDGNQHSGAVGFTVSQLTPSITSVSPTTMAPQNGNQTLTINGNNFVAGDTLTFVPPEGGTIASTASKLTVNSGLQITYLINNQNDSGNWTVQVNSPDGTQHSSTAGFTVSQVILVPSITTVSPTSMPPLNGNQTLTITGNNFVAGDTLTFVPPEGGTIASTASKLTVNSGTQISYLINNQNDSGNWTVQVNSPDGNQHSGAVGFTVSQVVAGPGITSVSPNSIPPLNGNQTLTITGNNFAVGDTLTFVPPEGGTIASSPSKLTVSSSTQIVYLINNFNDSGTWFVTVNSADGNQHSSAVSFTVTGASVGTASGFDYRNPKANATSATDGVNVPGLIATGKLFVGEYLGLAENDGYLRASDVQALKGLAIVSLYERTPTSISYFTTANADIDAPGAINAALLAGQPSGSAIYFTVDYGASDSASIAAVDVYFQEIRVKFDQYFAAHPGVNYKIGVYGPGTILPTVMNDPNVGASYSWVADPFQVPYAQANLEQTQDAVPAAGMPVDLDTAHSAEFGQWGAPAINVSSSSVSLPPAPPGSAGAATSFVVSGVSLGGGATLTMNAPAGCEFSEDTASGYTSTVFLYASQGGNLPPTTVYARVAASATANVSGNLTVSDSLDPQVDSAVQVTGSINTVTPPNAPVMSNPQFVGNVFSVHVGTQSGFTYDLKVKKSLADPSWTTVSSAPGNGSTLTLSDTSATNWAGFYSVVAH